MTIKLKARSWRERLHMVFSFLDAANRMLWFGDVVLEGDDDAISIME